MDLRDLWRVDEDGRPRLTLRQVWVRVLHLPRDSALAIDLNGGRMPWSMTDHLVADLWAQRANAGKKQGAKLTDHPSRPKAIKAKPQASDAQIERAKKRFAERRRKLNGG